MSTQQPKTPAAALPMPLTQSPSPQEAQEFASQVQVEYERYLEKRNALRKASGRIRRTALHQAMMS